MSELLKKLLKKKTNNEAVKTEKRVKPDFVQEYVLVNPNLILIDYRYFFSCDEIPVAYEAETNSGFQPCVQLPSNPHIVKYLKQLYAAKNEVLQDPKTRTISIIKLSNDDYVYILPNLDNMKCPIVLLNFKKEPHYSWVLQVNPQINRAIVEQIKTFKR